MSCVPDRQTNGQKMDRIASLVIIIECLATNKYIISFYRHLVTFILLIRYNIIGNYVFLESLILANINF